MNRLADEAAYFGAVQDGVDSQQERITELEHQLAESGRNVGGEEMSTTEIARNRILDLKQQLAKAQNSLEFKEALLYGDGTLILGLQDELATAKKQIVLLREYLEQLACLGNRTRHGNSVGNVLAIDALGAIDKDLSGCILCDAEPIAWDYKGKELWYFATDEEKLVATPLYKAKEQK